MVMLMISVVAGDNGGGRGDNDSSCARLCLIALMMTSADDYAVNGAYEEGNEVREDDKYNDNNNDNADDNNGGGDAGNGGADNGNGANHGVNEDDGATALRLHPPFQDTTA